METSGFRSRNEAATTSCRWENMAPTFCPKWSVTCPTVCLLGANPAVPNRWICFSSHSSFACPRVPWRPRPVSSSLQLQFHNIRFSQRCHNIVLISPAFIPLYCFRPLTSLTDTFFPLLLLWHFTESVIWRIYYHTHLYIMPARIKYFKRQRFLNAASLLNSRERCYTPSHDWQYKRVASARQTCWRKAPNELIKAWQIVRTSFIWMWCQSWWLINFSHF
jgi:hypothetical protein